MHCIHTKLPSPSTPVQGEVTPRLEDGVIDVTRAMCQSSRVTLKLSQAQASTYQKVRAAAIRFFDRPSEEKLRFRGRSLNHGFRMLGEEYSQSPDRPDQNESLSIWGRDLSSVPSEVHDEPVLRAVAEWREALIPIVEGLIDELVGQANPRPGLRFVENSYIQINSYRGPFHEKKNLQDVHEDGHLLTAIVTSAPGLEVSTSEDGPFEPHHTGPATVTIMAGSVLTRLSGGQIGPLYHRVVPSPGLHERLSVMYFINPETDQDLTPWVAGSDAEAETIRQYIVTMPHSFGLPDAGG